MCQVLLAGPPRVSYTLLVHKVHHQALPKCQELSLGKKVGFSLLCVSHFCVVNVPHVLFHSTLIWGFRLSTIFKVIDKSRETWLPMSSIYLYFLPTPPPKGKQQT